MSKKYLRNWFNYMCAAHYSLGEQIDNDSGGPFVDQHFELVLVLSVSTEVFSSGNCSAKQGFAIAKRLRNWSFARKFPVVEQPKCGAKNIPRIFRRGQTSSGLPPVNSSFGPSHWASLNFPAREVSDKFIRVTKTFICIFHFHAKSMQQSLLQSNQVERVVNSLQFPRGIFKCFQFMVLPSQALHHKEQSVSHVVTCYNPSFRTSFTLCKLDACRLKSLILDAADQIGDSQHLGVWQRFTTKAPR